MASPDFADLSAATLHLYRISGVVGLLLQKCGSQLANHMPFADVRTLELGEHVTQMAAGYHHVKRRVRQVLMLFDSGSLLIVMKDQIQLALLLTPQADLDKASLSAGAFLSNYAAQLEAAAPAAKKEMPDFQAAAVPLAIADDGRIKEKALALDDSVWPRVNAILETILGKVMGNAQAARLITRMSTAKHGEDVSEIGPVEARALARAVLDQIPNRAKRDVLLSELEHALTESKL